MRGVMRGPYWHEKDEVRMWEEVGLLKLPCGTTVEVIDVTRGTFELEIHAPHMELEGIYGWDKDNDYHGLEKLHIIIEKAGLRQLVTWLTSLMEEEGL